MKNKMLRGGLRVRLLRGFFWNRMPILVQRTGDYITLASDSCFLTNYIV